MIPEPEPRTKSRVSRFFGTIYDTSVKDIIVGAKNWRIQRRAVRAIKTAQDQEHIAKLVIAHLEEKQS